MQKFGINISELDSVVVAQIGIDTTRKLLLDSNQEKEVPKEEKGGGRTTKERGRE